MKSVTSQFLKSYQTRGNKIKDKTPLIYRHCCKLNEKRIWNSVSLRNDPVPVFTFHADKRFLPFPSRVSLRYGNQTKSDYL